MENRPHAVVRTLAVDGPWDGAEDAEVAKKVRGSLKVRPGFWSEEACAEIEAEVEGLGNLARANKFRPKTVDRTPLRSKYFFGYGYTYGSQISKKGEEQILPPELIDPVPDFIYDKLILPLEEKGVVPEGWINSAVVNDYRPGGMIVSHIDPPKLFARPIFITSFFAEGRLVFGSRFSFPNKGGAPETTPPKCICPMPRGSLTIMEGYSADGITHGIRPQDLDGRRVSIVLRHVFPNAPRLGQMPILHDPPADASWLNPPWFEEAEAASSSAAAPSSPTADAPSHVAGEDVVSLKEAHKQPVPNDVIDEFGRRRPKSGAGAERPKSKGPELAAGGRTNTARNVASKMTERQRGALARLQRRGQARGSRSRSPRR